MEKICRKCGVFKDEDTCFSIKTRKSGIIKRQAWCKDCQSDYHDIYYQDNKPDYFEKNRKNKKRLYEIIRIKKNKPCKDCGLCFPLVCMDFDHTGDDKKFNVSGSHGKYSLKRILLEISKCDVVCSNCHRIRTANRLLGASVIGNTSGFDPEDSTFDS